MSETLIRNPNYRRLMLATGISNLGDGVSALAFPWLATLITRDPLMISAVAMATRLPWFLLALPAGVWTDRADRRRMILSADLIRCALTLAVVTLIWLAGEMPPARPELWIAGLAALAFALGAAEVLRDNAAQTLLPSIVSRDSLERANGRLWTVEQVMGQFIGPPLAGVLIALSVPAPFLLDAATFAAAALLVAGMRVPQRQATPRAAFRAELAEGWHFMRGHPVVLRLALMLGVLNAAIYATLVMLPLFAQDVMGLGSAGLGLIMTATAAGGVTGGMLGPWVARRLGGQRSLFVALAVWPVINGVIALWPGWPVVAVAMFWSMAAGVLWNVVTVSYRQRVIPDALLGRVNAIYRFFGWGMMPLGAFAGGLIAAWAEPVIGREMALRAVFAAAAAVTALLALYGWRRLRI